MADDPYSILGVDPGATDSEIKAAYRQLAVKYHPDRNPGFQDAANEKLKVLNGAYDRIKAAGPARPADPSESPASKPDSEQESQHADHGRNQAGWSRNGPSSSSDDANHDESAEPELDHQAAIAMQLARAGVLQDADRDHPIVEVVASIMPADTRIFVCVSYSALAISGQYEFKELRRSFMRIAPTDGVPTALPLPLGPTARTEVMLCTANAMLWTTWRVVPADFAWEQVTVTAYSLAFADIVGSQVTSRRKGTVDVWVDDGPTLTFRTAPQDAEALSAYIDNAAVSQ